jgi:hypothetical protein
MSIKNEVKRHQMIKSLYEEQEYQKSIMKTRKIKPIKEKCEDVYYNFISGN